MASYLVIGGGPSAPEIGPALLASRKFDRIIGTNRCLRWGFVPDLYWLSDPVAITIYREEWQKFEGEIISNVDLGRPTTPFPYQGKDIIFHGRCSGILCCRVALSRGATELHLVGFDGYKPEDRWIDHNDKPMKERGNQADRINKAQSDAFADIAAKHPDVAVTVYGRTRISLPTSWRNEP